MMYSKNLTRYGTGFFPPVKTNAPVKLLHKLIRSSINELEETTWARVRGEKAALDRARSGASFRHIIGRNTVVKNFGISLKNEVMG